jgi:superfamily II DNA or RNA helicase
LHSGEFTEASQEQVFGDTKVFEGLTDDLRKLPYKKCLIFTASIKDCEAVTAQLKSAGFDCVQVHSKMSEVEFSANMVRFMKMQVHICVSVGTLTRGFDFPAIDLIVIRRATTSLPLFLQMIGRGSRIEEGKKYFTVLDYGGNYLRHGLWDRERDWLDYWNKPKKARDGVAPIKLCPVCEFISPASASVCANCGYEFIKSDTPTEVGKLIEITEIYSRLVAAQKQIGSLTAQELSIYARLKNKKNFAARIARAINQKQDGYLLAYAKEMGYKESWVDWQLKTIKPNEKIEFTNFILK